MMHIEQEIIYHRQSFQKLTGRMLCCHVFTTQCSWQRPHPSTKFPSYEKTRGTVHLCLKSSKTHVSNFKEQTQAMLSHLPQLFLI